MSDGARERGQQTYERLFGEKKELGPKPTPLEVFTVDHLFANLWSREQLEMHQRSMITIALLAALGRDRELAKHIKAARHLGIADEQISEIMLHVAHYAGWPAGHNGQRVAQKVFKCTSEPAHATAATPRRA